MHLIENILPITEEWDFKLSQKILASPLHQKLPESYACFLRQIKADAELFRRENIDLKIEEKKLENEFEKIMGSLTAQFQGREQTMQEIARYLEDPDRTTREAAYRTRSAVRLKTADTLDDLYSKMLGIRHQKTQTHSPPALRRKRSFRLEGWQNGRIERFFGTLKTMAKRMKFENRT